MTDASWSIGVLACWYFSRNVGPLALVSGCWTVRWYGWCVFGRRSGLPANLVASLTYFGGAVREPMLFVSFWVLPVICVCGEPSSLLSSFRPDYSGSVDPPHVVWTLPILACSTFRHRRTVITGRIGSIQFNTLYYAYYSYVRRTSIGVRMKLNKLIRNSFIFQYSQQD